MEFRPPASVEVVRSVERATGVVFPADYVDFMTESNGAEGPIGNSAAYLSLWPIEKIVPLNADYRAAEFWPGLVLFGSDGGGEAYGFMADALNPDRCRVVDVPFIGRWPEDAIEHGHSLLDLLRSLVSEGGGEKIT
jgi:hypothetical protein